MELSTVGPSSSSIEFSGSWPNPSSSSGPAAVDSSRSEPEDFQESSQEIDVRRLKSPRLSDFVQKCKIVA